MVWLCNRWKYGEKAKLYYVDTDSFTFQPKADNIYNDITEDVKTRFGTSNYELDRSLPKWKNKKVVGLTKDELDGKLWKKFLD